MKTKEVPALATPTINNAINLNLNQNDLVELAIAEKITQLDEAITVQENELKEFKAKYQEDIEKFKRDIVNKNIGRDKDYLNFLKVSHELKLEVTKHESIHLHTYGNQVKIVATYNDVNLSNVEQYKDPYQYAKRNFSTQSLKVDVAEHINIKYEAKKGNLELTYERQLSVNQKDYHNLITPYLKKEAKLQEDLFNVKMAYLNYKYGEKRIKAQITKAALLNTAQGQNILSLLETATNIKMLG
jgi:hypothetical protein